MTGRRGANRIRGPHSALTDFLAANNISAQQIRDDYDRRRQQAVNDPTTANNDTTAHDEDVAAAVQAAASDSDPDLPQKSKKRKRSGKDTAADLKKAKAAAAKNVKRKKGKKGDDDSDYDSDMGNMYRKARPPPGQLAWCETCNKRFTVTPYNKEGADGGLLCMPCGKALAKDMKQEKKAVVKPAGRKRRKIESDRLDGIVSSGARTLSHLCISKLLHLSADIEALGDLPAGILAGMSELFSKKRVMRSKTLPLFLRGDLTTVNIPDAAYLEAEDYHQIFAIVPNLQKLVLQNACQLKDPEIAYMIERCTRLKHLQLYAPNLVTNDMWHRLFGEAGSRFEAVKLKWLDAAFEDATVEQMVKHGQNLRRVKFELCRRLGESAVKAISQLPRLQHLSLQINAAHFVQAEVLSNLIAERGSQLETLSLRAFADADNSVTDAIHQHCTRLSKLRMSQNDTATDAGFAALFTDWDNLPLKFADFNSDRDVDNNNSEGPAQAVGLASAGFRALMAHSGSALRHLNIASCRHIELGAFMDVFNGAMEYPALEEINVSFCNRIDNSVVAGIFRSCPSLKKLVAFGCFSVHNIVVPRNVVVIGIPTAQDAIEQFGVGIGVDEAIGRMVEAAA